MKKHAPLTSHFLLVNQLSSLHFFPLIAHVSAIFLCYLKMCVATSSVPPLPYLLLGSPLWLRPLLDAPFTKRTTVKLSSLIFRFGSAPLSTTSQSSGGNVLASFPFPSALSWSSSSGAPLAVSHSPHGCFLEILVISLFFCRLSSSHPILPSHHLDAAVSHTAPLLWCTHNCFHLAELVGSEIIPRALLLLLHDVPHHEKSQHATRFDPPGPLRGLPHLVCSSVRQESQVRLFSTLVSSGSLCWCSTFSILLFFLFGTENPPRH